VEQGAQVAIDPARRGGGAGASYYHVYRATTPGGPYAWAGYTYETSIVDYGDWDDWTSYPLQNGTPYYYVVTAVGDAGESGYSNEASATPIAPPPPPVPGGLTAAAGDRQVLLSWSESPTATMYWVRRGTSPGGPYTHTDNVYGTGYWDNQVENGTTYYCVISAVNSGGESANSIEVSATPTGPPPPAAPTGLTATAGKKRVSLKWTQSTSSGVTQNRVYRSTTSGGGYSLRASITAGTSFNDTGLTSGVTYYYVATAVNGSTGKESAYSNQGSARPR
jgi:fibronectin type 3 domain-containing protein